MEFLRDPGSVPIPACLLAWGCLSLLSASAATTPWWDDFPALIQTGDARVAAASHATGVLCGAANDPAWGIFAQRQAIVSSAQTITNLHAAGFKVLTWFEGYGTCGSYIVELKHNPDGSWLKTAADTNLTQVIHSHWDWQLFDGGGEIGWTGPHGYFTDEPFAHPWTRTHPRYGCPPMTYPDGRIATGYSGPTNDPRNSLVLDAGCSKDVLGRVSFEYNYHAAVNQLQTNTLQPHGPVTGLVRVEDAPAGPPDPGFTPAEWKKIKKPGYAGDVDAGKDSACPIWLDYVRASVRQALDAGIDGLWVDNFSPWDSFGGNPVLKAFGEWSVAGFRDHLRTAFSTHQLASLGLSNAASFDIRRYLQERCRQWGGHPEKLDDPTWRDARWRDDALWRAYLIYKRQQGTRALSRYYQTLKAEAAAAGKPDFLVSGNDIPIFSLGWARGDLDMVSTELNWGWHLTTGPRGLLPPPRGNYAPVYKLAREHARSRFVNAWMYVPEAQLGKTNLARVLYYQALANHAFPMPYPGERTAGNPPTDAAFFDFVRRSAPVFGSRVPVEEIGLYHSSSTQLLEMLPGGFRDHARQPHSFAFWGWGTALTELHCQWRAVPEWKLEPALSSGLRMLVIPEAEVLDQPDAERLRSWVRSGGTLIFTGKCGVREGEAGNFNLYPGADTFADRLGMVQAQESSELKGVRTLALDKGLVVYLPDDPGLAYYLADQERPSRLGRFRSLLEAARSSSGRLALEAPTVASPIGLTLYRRDGALFVDVNNTSLDLDHDVLAPTGPLRFTLRLPEDLRARDLALRVLTPDRSPKVKWSASSVDQVEVWLDSVEVYASVVVERAGHSK